MHILIAPDSFKGSLSAQDFIRIIKKEIHNCIPDCRITSLPMADGGEGTLDILLNIGKGTMHNIDVHGPFMELINAGYAVLSNNTVIIEMAKESGLPLVSEDKRNPELTTTYGTGELIKDALDNGYKRIIIGVGGSATNDAGLGALHALGINFYDKDDVLLEPVGKNLINVTKIDISHLHPAAKNTEFIIMCDIDNPLTGPTGATYVFSPQKGADRAMQERLEKGMIHFASLLNHFSGKNIDKTPGAGAAGGLAAGLMTFLGGKVLSGISTVLELSDFEEVLQGLDPENHTKKFEKVDLVITGEGRADSQSAHGKVLWGVGTASKKYDIPVVAITGCLGDGYEELYNCGISKIYPNKTESISLDYAISHTKELLAKNVRQLLSDLQYIEV